MTHTHTNGNRSFHNTFDDTH